MIKNGRAPGAEHRTSHRSSLWTSGRVFALYEELHGRSTPAYFPFAYSNNAAAKVLASFAVGLRGK
jgi:hypothetical protein